MDRFIQRIIISFVLLLVLFCLFACSNKNDDLSTETPTEAESEGVETSTEAHVHMIRKRPLKAPNCVDEGHEEYEYCISCDYTTYKEIAPTGHDIKQITLKKPTVSLSGEAKDVCELCGYEGETHVLPPIKFTEGNFSQRYVTLGEELRYLLDGIDPSLLEYEWTLDGETVSNEGAYTPDEQCLEKLLEIRVFDADRQELCYDTIFCSRLPVLYIETENRAPITSKTELIPGSMTLQGNTLYTGENDLLYNGAIEIRGRGNSTWGFPKKPYKIKLDDSTDLFGFGKSKHWVLLANYLDESMMRSYLAEYAGEELGLASMQSTFVDVILNGQHIGLYQLCEQVKADEDRVPLISWENIAEDLAKEIYKLHGLTKTQRNALEDMLVCDLSWVTSGEFVYDGKEYLVEEYVELPNATGGFLIEMSREFDEVSKYRTTRGVPILFKDPEYLTSNELLQNYAFEYIQAFEDALYSDDFTTRYDGETVCWRDMVDMDSLVRFWLVSAFFCNEYGNKSTYMYMDPDGKLTFGPVWDFDFSSGGSNPWMVFDPIAWNAHNRWWFSRMLADEAFVEEIYATYPEFREVIYGIVKDGGLMDNSYPYIKEAAEVNDDMWFYKRGFEVDFIWLKYWMTERLAWMVVQFANRETLFHSLMNNSPAPLPDRVANNRSDRVGIVVNNVDGKRLLCMDRTIQTLTDNLLVVSADTDTLLINVNVYSTAGVELVLYINGEAIDSVELEPYDKDNKPVRYASFSLDTSLFEENSCNIVRVICNRTQGNSPYQNSFYVKK